MPLRVPGKKQTLLAYLQRGVAMVHLDARRPGVLVPPEYAREAHLRLNLSYRYAIPDLDVSEARVQATLSFGGRPFRCVLPWESIFGITSHTSGDGQVWPEDLPTEVVQTMADPRDRAPEKRARLSAVSPEGTPEQESGPESSKGPDAGAARRHLRLVR